MLEKLIPTLGIADVVFTFLLYPICILVECGACPAWIVAADMAVAAVLLLTFLALIVVDIWRN